MGKTGTKDRGFGTGLGVWVCMVRVIGCLTLEISLGEAFAVPGLGRQQQQAEGSRHHPSLSTVHHRPIHPPTNPTSSQSAEMKVMVMVVVVMAMVMIDDDVARQHRKESPREPLA